VETNECGGAEALVYADQPAHPGDACGGCGEGLLACISPDKLGCLGDVEDSCSETPNSCGGHHTLRFDGEVAAPGETCGPCYDGTLVCESPNTLDCSGESDADACAPTERNACGGHGPLSYNGSPAKPGASCGPCGDGKLSCANQTLMCAGATIKGYCNAPQLAPNECGGLGPARWQGQASSPNVSCGACLEGILTCGTPTHLVCVKNAYGAGCEAPGADDSCTLPDDAGDVKPPLPSAPAPEPAPATTSVVTMPLKARRLLSNPFDGRLYASVSGSQPNGNSIAIIDPAKPEVMAFVPIGPEPRNLALSDDGKVLWVVVTGDHYVRRLDLTTQKVTLEFPIASADDWVSIRALPGSHDSLFTARGSLTVFDNGVPRPYSGGYDVGIAIETGSPSLAFGYNSYNTGFQFMTLCLNEQGAFVQTERRDLFESFGYKFTYSDGKIFSNGGKIFSVSNRTQAGTFAQGGGDVAPDPIGRRVYFMRSYGGDILLLAYDMDTLVATGTETVHHGYANSHDLVRWGAHGLAYLAETTWTDPDMNIAILQTPLVP
jgi:hypothetical protein